MDNVTQIAGIAGITVISVAAIAYNVTDAGIIVGAAVGAIGGFLTGVKLSNTNEA